MRWCILLVICSVFSVESVDARNVVVEALRTEVVRTTADGVILVTEFAIPDVARDARIVRATVEYETPCGRSEDSGIVLHPVSDIPEVLTRDWWTLIRESVEMRGAVTEKYDGEESRMSADVGRLLREVLRSRGDSICFVVRTVSGDCREVARDNLVGALTLQLTIRE